ncbi:ectoine hydroxylase [Gracilibacillus halophilus YIM-C55.5]|uniref:Ectoine hydroxylase n=1 Tax=Gracilibacillus halophilus YIM-C55.5 TaxID=1308866 RepID=N4W5V8_9BACI|nr:ectoine hydroxylase [Gracilibacillus halophilus]ENH95563.1 ectoine hydroxylase [Gracilibacillus halophilus YIM-C55.5]
MVDLYPSRINGYPEIFERKDPVIHSSTPEDGPLNQDQLTSYEENGYLFLPTLFSEQEVKTLQAELHRNMDDNKQSDQSYVVRESQSNDIRSVFDVHHNDEFFQNLSAHERIVRIAEQLLGSQVYINQSRINFKPGFKGKDFYWHSDFETWHMEDGMPNMRAVSCSIILTDNYHYNGPLLLIPGSHRWYVQCVGKTPDNHFEQSLKMQNIGVPDHDSINWLMQKGGGIDSATGPAGSVLFFESNTMHGSNSNISPMPRSNVFFVFNSIDNQLVEPFANTSPRPEFIANRKDIKPIQAKSFDLTKKQYALF